MFAEAKRHLAMGYRSFFIKPNEPLDSMHLSWGGVRINQRIVRS